MKKDLLQDARKLLSILAECGTWEARNDAKLSALLDLLTQQHPNEKVLIFTQFADTVHYLTSQLRAAACDIQTQPIERPAEQHDLVKRGVEHIVAEETKGVGGQLGRPSGARLRTYERLKHYADSFKDTLFPPSPDLLNAIDEIYRYPLQESARDTLNRQMRSGITHEQLAQLVVDLRADDRLCLIQEETEQQEPQIICSLGLFEAKRTIWT